MNARNKVVFTREFTKIPPLQHGIIFFATAAHEPTRRFTKEAAGDDKKGIDAVP